MSAKYGVRVLVSKESPEGNAFYVRTLFKEVEIDENLSSALNDLKAGRWTYIYLDTFDWDPLCVCLNLLLQKNIIPAIVFSSEKFRSDFFKHFYGGVIEGMPFSCTVENKYAIAEGVNENAWNGRASQRTINISNLPPEMKLFLKTRLLSHWAAGDYTDRPETKTDIVIYIKTISKESSGESIAEYYDYEDYYLRSAEFQSKPIFIFAFDKYSFPRPEKIFESTNELIPAIGSLRLKNYKIIGEADVGIPVLRITGVDNSFFDSLDFNEKRDFARLLMELLWSKFTKPPEMRRPDDFEREKFSTRLDKVNQMSGVFAGLFDSFRAYQLSNYQLLETKFKDMPNVTFDVNEELFFGGTSEERTVFVPSDPFLRKVFDFIFAKDLFYAGLESREYSWLVTNVREHAKKFAMKLVIAPVIYKPMPYVELYKEKIDMEEQYGDERLKEIDCKKIIFRVDGGQKMALFVPIRSEVAVDDVIRNGKKDRIKYVNLLPGDSFSKEYWNYRRLIAALRMRPELIQDDLLLEKSMAASERFRSKLREFLEINKKTLVIADVEERLNARSDKPREVNYLTIASWIETVMCPIRTSYPTVAALTDIFKSKNSDYTLNWDAFIDACTYIKQKKSLVSAPEEGEKKIEYVVERVEEGPFKVRGENIGKFYTTA